MIRSAEPCAGLRWQLALVRASDTLYEDLHLHPHREKPKSSRVHAMVEGTISRNKMQDLAFNHSSCLQAARNFPQNTMPFEAFPAKGSSSHCLLAIHSVHGLVEEKSRSKGEGQPSRPQDTTALLPLLMLFL